MEYKPLISIGIPTYNRPKGLEKTIQNFLCQTYKNIEIIISDNNSDDPEVLRVCNEYSRKDSRVKLYSQKKNIGMFDNFEFVLKKAQGDYFTWASDDDSHNRNFVKECWKIHDNNPNLSLVSPICKVFRADGVETMLYKPDFHTNGLKQLDRIKKILFYIKKSHGALTGLYKTEHLRKIKLKSILDSDGLLLYELSAIGGFYQLKIPLITTHLNYVENDKKTSLTFEKEKFIRTYKMKPYFMWFYFEKITLFLVFLLQTVKSRNIVFKYKFQIIPALFSSFFGKNRNKLLSVLKTLFFYFKNRKIGFIIILNKTDDISNIHIDSTNYLNLIYSKNIGTHGKYEISNCSNEEKVHFLNKRHYYFEGNWSTLHAQQQYTLDYIRSKKLNYSHIVLINHLQLKSIEILEKKIIKKSKHFKLFNRAYKIDDNLIFPNRNYVDFKDDTQLTIKELKKYFGKY